MKKDEIENICKDMNSILKDEGFCDAIADPRYQALRSRLRAEGLDVLTADIKIRGKDVQVKVRVVRMDSEEYREVAL